MKPAKYDIRTYQGDSYTLDFDIEGDWSGKTWRMTIRSPLSEETPALEYDEIEVTYDSEEDETNVRIPISPADSESLDANVIYFYDVDARDTEGTNTILAGTFSLENEVSR